MVPWITSPTTHHSAQRSLQPEKHAWDDHKLYQEEHPHQARNESQRQGEELGEEWRCCRECVQRVHTPLH